MMFTPCGPKAVPTGGAGLAAPAGHCSFTSAVTFLAMWFPSFRTLRRRHRRFNWSAAMTRAVAGGTLVSPELQIVEFDRRGTSEQRHLHLHLALIGQDLFDRPREVRERTLGDLDRLPDEEGDLLLGLGRLHFLGDAEEPVHLVLAEGRGILPLRHELDHALDRVDHVEGLLPHLHVHQDIPGVELPLDRDLLPVLDLDHFLHRHERLADQLLVHRPRVLGDPLLDQPPHLVLMPRRGLDRVPPGLHGVAQRVSRATPSTRTLDRSQSSQPIARPRTTERTMIEIVARFSSGTVGQVIFCSSAHASRRNATIAWTRPVTLPPPVVWTASTLLRLLVTLVLVAPRAVLLPLHALRVLPPVLRGEVVPVLALGTLHNDLFAWHRRLAPYTCCRRSQVAGLKSSCDL